MRSSHTYFEFADDGVLHLRRTRVPLLSLVVAWRAMNDE